MRIRLLLLASLAACSGPKNAFDCTDSASCRMGGTTGTCEPNGFCSFSDPTCPNGSRYGSASGSVSGVCVGQEMMGSDAGGGSGVEPPGIGAWTNGTRIPNAPRYAHATVVNGNDLYAIGGIYGNAALADVWVAHVDQSAIEPQLAIPSWTQTTSLPAARRAFGAAFYAGYIYVVAGLTSADSADVSAAVVNSDGTIGTWTSTTPLPVTLRSHAVTASGSHLYVVGGKQSGSSGIAKSFVLRADMANGAVSSWQNAATLDTTVFSAGAVAVNGYLYVVGGCASGKGMCSPPLDIVEVAKINADGSLGPFAHTTALPMGRSHHAIAASASKQELFVLAGSFATQPNANGIGDVIVAHINTDGTIGPWRTAPALTMNEVRGTAEVVGKYLIDLQAYVQIAQLL